MDIPLRSIHGDGQITYNDAVYSPVDFEVKGSEKLITAVTAYLNKEREFWIPESQDIDDYRVDLKKPIDGLDYFEMALSEMFAEIDIEVLWPEVETETE